VQKGLALLLEFAQLQKKDRKPEQHGPEANARTQRALGLLESSPSHALRGSLPVDCSVWIRENAAPSN
jgi:hypothetical protein